MNSIRPMPGPFREDDLQKAVVSYLQARRNTVRDLAYCHIPNMAKRGPRLATWLKSMGLVAGAPDLIIWLRGRIVHIELKTLKGHASDNQKTFGDNLKALGYEYHVVAAETPGDAVSKVLAIIDGAA